MSLSGVDDERQSYVSQFFAASWLLALVVYIKIDLVCLNWAWGYDSETGERLGHFCSVCWSENLSRADPAAMRDPDYIHLPIPDNQMF